MANDFMKNINKKVLDGEVVSFNKTFPNVEEARPTEVAEEKPTKKSKKGKKEVVETTVEETVENEVVEETPTEETTEVEE